METETLSIRIRTEAERLGFGAVGFARAEPASTMPVFEKWLSDGMAAGMNFLSRNKDLREDPRVLAPGSHSIIVVAARYSSNPEPGSGFAMHSRGRDYHLVLRSKLEELRKFIAAEHTLATARICVDSAPVLERHWAIASGIGWRGKQGQIVSPVLGCCILLGELLVDLELEPSKPMESKCGSCDLCRKACPSGALGTDGRVDARKCVSYLTIEHKGDFSAEQQAYIGQAFFGCDLCTSACPWNKFGKDKVMPELQPRSMPSADDCLKMNDEAFRKSFKDTVVFRSGLARLQRNALLVAHSFS